MTLMKSILLGSAAGIVAVASAQAADLPTRKAAPAEYVRICNVGGMAGFVIPGSDTCLKIGGYITAHFSAGNIETNYAWTPGTLRGTSLTATAANLRSDIGFFTRANVSLDTRTNTAYGVLRGYMELQVDTGNGFDNGVGAARRERRSTFGSQAYVNLAYIQWAGITAGKAPSFFSFFGGGEGWDNIYSPDQQGFNQPIQFAYTATFGGGFSATIAAVSPAPLGASGPGNDENINTTNFGMNAPDIVGNLRLDQSWGALQVSGAAHNVRVFETAAAGTVPGAPAFAPSQDIWGWAFNVGGKLNLPSFGAGDFIQAQFTYTKNAMVYSGISVDGGCGSWTGNGLGDDLRRYLLRWSHPGWQRLSGRRRRLGRSAPRWSITSILTSRWIRKSPTLNLHWSDSQGQLSTNATSWIGGVVAHWDPVPQLDFELDLLYQATHQSTPGNWGAGTVINTAGVVVTPAAFKANNDGFTGRLQISRSW